MRCHRVSYSRRGQSIVETALLLPLLMLLVMGSADLGRVFYYSIAVTNAAREAARQGTYYNPLTNSNSSATYAQVLNAARQDVPGDVTLSIPASSPSHCLPAGSPSTWRAYYPTDPNTGYVFICFNGTENAPEPAVGTIQVTILYNFAPVTPLADVVGSSLIQVEASTTMQVQAQ
jgi:Flp pilus assembly protein TadG